MNKQISHIMDLIDKTEKTIRHLAQELYEIKREINQYTEIEEEKLSSELGQYGME